MKRIEGIDYDEELTKIRESIATKQEIYVKEHPEPRRTNRGDSALS